jgi:hypothetical protein
MILLELTLKNDIPIWQKWKKSFSSPKAKNANQSPRNAQKQSMKIIPFNEMINIHFEQQQIRMNKDLLYN